jgi:hypothetical protein
MTRQESCFVRQPGLGLNTLNSKICGYLRSSADKNERNLPHKSLPIGRLRRLHRARFAGARSRLVHHLFISSCIRRGCERAIIASVGFGMGVA